MHFKTVLAHLKSKTFSVGQPWWPTFFHIETCWTHIFVLDPPLKPDDNLCKKMIDAKSKQNCKLSTLYTAEDKRVWRYYNNNYYRIKDGFNIVTFQTERRIVSTTVAQVITVITVEIWRWCNFDMISWRHMNAMLMSYRHRMLLKILPTKLFWKLKVL